MLARTPFARDLREQPRLPLVVHPQAALSDSSDLGLGKVGRVRSDPVDDLLKNCRCTSVYGVYLPAQA